MLRASSLRTVPARVHCRGRPAAAPFLHPLSLDGGEPCEDGQPQIPVTLELRTGDERADSLTEPTSSFYVALHTGESRVYLHTEPGRSSGALLGQAGGTDSLSFAVPSRFADPVALWVAPAEGSWRVEGARLRVREGDGDGAPLSFALSPVGGGELRRVRAVREPTLAEKAETREQGMDAYASLKTSIVGVSAALSVPGCGAAVFIAGTHVAFAFLLGTATGLAYVSLLERGVDGLRGMEGSDGSAQGTGAPGRLAATAALLFFAARLVAERSDDAGQMRTELLALVAGFLLHRVAVLFVGLRSTAEE